MIQLSDKKVVILDGAPVMEEEAQARGIDLAAARKGTLASRILSAHNRSQEDGKLKISFDALCSHDITYVGIIQNARASGLEEFPVPYVLTNCHNSLCAVGGTINEDDHVFGLSAAKKYGGIFVPPHLAVLHQYMREMMTHCGGMIMGSDSHTRYGALGVMGVGEGGPELVKQLLKQTWDIEAPEVVAVWLEGKPRPGVGPQDVALALIGAVFADGFVKNRILEFMGPGIAGLSMDYRMDIDVMTTETACLSSIWPTDDTVAKWYALHGREGDFKQLELDGPALYDGLIVIRLDEIEPMIALPFHPGNVHTIREFSRNAREILAGVEEEAKTVFGEAGQNFRLTDKIRDGFVIADQGIIAGCAGGLFENLSYAAAILGTYNQNNPAFTFALYPASVPVASACINNGSTEKLMTLGAIVRTAFCGPCFGAGDTPANGCLSIRHTTRNFPNREGSKPGEGQLAAVALMDARSIAMTAAHGGKIMAATELDWENDPELKVNLNYHFNPAPYLKRVYNGYGKPQKEDSLIFGPNIADWPAMPELPEHLILEVSSVILDPVTTTDELIPSGETSSLRSNPEKLAEFTLSRKDPGYVSRAKAIRDLERQRLANPRDPELVAKITNLIDLCKKQPIAEQMLAGPDFLKWIGLGSVIYANRPGDGSAREQAASSQKILGGWANMARDYATRRYHSNLVNWGLIPFIVGPEIGQDLKPGDYVLIPHIRSYLYDGHPLVMAALLHMNEDSEKIWSEQIALGIRNLTPEERQVLMAGSLINYNAAKLDRK